MRISWFQVEVPENITSAQQELPLLEMMIARQPGSQSSISFGGLENDQWVIVVRDTIFRSPVFFWGSFFCTLKFCLVFRHGRHEVVLVQGPCKMSR